MYPRLIILFLCFLVFPMQTINLPLFEKFPPLIQQYSINNWTTNDFWIALPLSTKERNRFNRQRMYRILRKLVELGFLEKKVNHENSRFSLFSETKKINIFRGINNESEDLSKMRLEETRISFKISFLEKQIEAYKQLEINFPSMKKKILYVRNNCKSEIIELKAYQLALKSIIYPIES